MRKLSWHTAAIALIALGLSSCTDMLDSRQFEKNRANADDFFSFSTTEPIVLCLDYGVTGARALVSLYDRNPMIALDSSSVTDESIVPLYRQFTDENGKVFTSLDLPLHEADTVWLYSEAMTLPRCERCVVENGVIFNFRHVDYTDTKGVTKAVVGNPKKYQIKDNFYTIVKWSDKYGKPNDVNGIISGSSLSYNDINAIKTAVWKGSYSKPGYLDNSSYTSKSTELVNTSILSACHDEYGQVRTVESAEVFVNFVHENGWYENVIGYYFYPSDNVPSSPDGLKKYIIMPNASLAGNGPFGQVGFNNTDWGSGNAPASANQKFQLLYEDADGNMTQYFPAGTTIGYFVIANGWNATGGNTELPKEQTKAMTRSAIGTKSVPTETVYIKPGQTQRIDLGYYTNNAEWIQNDYSCSANTPVNENGSTRYSDVFTWTTGTATITVQRTTWSVWGVPTTEILKVFNIVVTYEDAPVDNRELMPGVIDFSQPVYYSNKEWNDRARCINFSYAGQLIYGFEDYEDNTFEDVLFTVSSNPSGAILNPENQDIIDESRIKEEQLRIGQRDFATYCYEDLWPYTGDYDMNDVVIEHRASMYFDNDNDLLEVIDSFTVCNEKYSSGAGVRDAFAVRIPYNERGELMRIPAGAVDESETESIILFENAQDNLGEVFVITRMFNKGSMKLSGLTRGTGLDPYIIPVMPTDGNSCYESHRREVHLPKKDGTSMIEPMYYINDLEAFYVARDNRHPFAISIPLPTAQTQAEITKAKYDGSMFVIPAEMSDIESQYSGFGSWVESGGNSNTGWYRKYNPGYGETIRYEMKRQ